MPRKSTLTTPTRLSGHDDLADLLRKRIIKAMYKPGSRLPNRLALVSELGVSSHTIQAALDTLESEGFVESKPRVGSFVSSCPPHTHVFALAVTPSLSGLDSLENTGFSRLLYQTAKTLSLPDGKSFRVYDGVDDRTTSETFDRFRDDLVHCRFAGVISDYVRFSVNLIAESPVPWVSAPSVVATQKFIRMRFSLDDWIKQAAAWLHKRGRKRAAFLFNAVWDLGATEQLASLASAQGLQILRKNCQAADPHSPAWIRRAVELILSQPVSTRPDAIIVGDDVLLEHALLGVLDAGLRPNQIDVVAHANFPSPRPVVFPVVRLGLDLRQFILTAVDLIERRLANMEIPVAGVEIPVVFEDQLQELPASVLPRRK